MNRPRDVFTRLALCLVLLLVSSLVSRASVPESHAQAGYLALFARYIEWPPTPAGDPSDRPFVVGVLGHDPFGTVLEAAFADLRINGRPVQVKRFGSAGEARNCDLVFISREESRRQAVWLKELSGAPLLVVSDTESALDDGAGIAIVREKTPSGEKMRFDVNLPAVERAGLKISSRMMVSARRVLKPEIDGS